jgi:hypothetical protein
MTAVLRRNGTARQKQRSEQAVHRAVTPQW